MGVDITGPVPSNHTPRSVGHALLGPIEKFVPIFLCGPPCPLTVLLTFFARASHVRAVGLEGHRLL